MNPGKLIFEMTAKLRSLNASITHEQRKIIFDAIIEAGISHENSKNWKAVIMKIHGESHGKTKKILKALANSDKKQIDRILSGLV